ncbi:hypothetical protein [Streptomyces sp. TRM70350]|uniref:hypothetical protein n=1 Tax=Streptomyces sp. TRM70350 TaxID=2856165 RepID=UPI001C46C0DA|nr:hypothetical protein [Streptomyces sp. TRM70350]MBV7698573.1 hypothetical protein [Streptomyces sp. TRM70350]
MAVRHQGGPLHAALTRNRGQRFAGSLPDAAVSLAVTCDRLASRKPHRTPRREAADARLSVPGVTLVSRRTRDSERELP